MNIEGPCLGQLDASFSARRDHLAATPAEPANKMQHRPCTGRRFCRRARVKNRRVRRWYPDQAWQRKSLGLPWRHVGHWHLRTAARLV
jgi:hypothetical protein